MHHQPYHMKRTEPFAHLYQRVTGTPFTPKNRSYIGKHWPNTQADNNKPDAH